MSKYIRIRNRPLSQQIAHDIDKEVLKDLRKYIPPTVQTTMELSIHNCVFGNVLIGSYQNKLQAVELGADVDECYRNFINKWGKANPLVTTRTNTKIVQTVLHAIDTGDVDPSLEIDLYGTGTYFQRRVWEVLRSIQPGSTMTYQDIATEIKRENSARAIGNACGANPIAIIVPCHRAIRTGGKSGGYAWGEELKKKLLDRESTC